MSERHVSAASATSGADSGPRSGNQAAGPNGAWRRQLANWPALLAGLVAGLVLGLILGWYAWPVQWVNAWPGDLNPEVRAHYIAAVAEAYTYYGDDRAAEIARQRLFDLNPDLAEEIAAAQTYFNENPQRESRTYIVNLGRLADALDVQSPAIVTDADPAVSGDAPAEGEESSAAPTALVGPSVIDWLNWVFVVIAAVALVAGSVYILYDRGKRRRSDETDEVFDEIEDEDVGGFEEDDWDNADDGAIYRRPLTTPAAMGPAPPEGDVYFDDEGFDSEGFDSEGFDDEGVDDRRLADAGFDPDEDFETPGFDEAAARARFARTSDDDDESSHEDDSYEDDSDADDDFDRRGDQAPDTQAPDTQAPDSGEAPRTETTAAAAPTKDPAKPKQPASSQSGAGQSLGAVAAAGAQKARRGKTRAAPPAKDTDTEKISSEGSTAGEATTAEGVAPDSAVDGAHTELGVYTVQYLSSLQDYDEPHDIIDDASGSIIGECGMGVNMKNGYLQNNPEHVIALDVYLFDKKDDTRILSQNRILLCEYVHENKLEHAFSKERPNDPEPLIVRPDTRFQLTGNSLVMDCEVLEVDFVADGDAKGIFQSLKLKLTVRDRE